MPGTINLIQLTLLDPHGATAAHASPESVNSGRDIVDVAHPTAGRWTALIYARPDERSHVQYEFFSQRFKAAEKVIPSDFTLPPGATKDVQLDVRLPHDAGDASEDLVLDSSAGSSSVVPLVLRSLIDVHGDHGEFRGEFNGGNGRNNWILDAQTFEFDVPPGRDAITATLRFDGDPAGVEIDAALVSPDGQALAVASTRRIDPPAYDLVDANALQAVALAPKGGPLAAADRAVQRQRQRADAPLQGHTLLRGAATGCRHADCRRTPRQ